MKTSSTPIRLLAMTGTLVALAGAPANSLASSMHHMKRCTSHQVMTHHTSHCSMHHSMKHTK
jgi:hypothetical protein